MKPFPHTYTAAASADLFNGGAGVPAFDLAGALRHY